MNTKKESMRGTFHKIEYYIIRIFLILCLLIAVIKVLAHEIPV